MVLTEVLAFYANKGTVLRKTAVMLAERLASDPNTVIVPQTSLQFQEALSFYAGREDKEWSLTDCASFQIMQDSGLKEALSHDHHFEQAGFVPLLKEL